jgi:hypothetical protein
MIPASGNVVKVNISDTSSGNSVPSVGAAATTASASSETVFSATTKLADLTMGSDLYPISALSKWQNYHPSVELTKHIQSMRESRFVHVFGCGIETESAGRALNKGQVILRHDLAALPYLIAGKNDIVSAPPLRPEFIEYLREKTGILHFPEFRDNCVDDGSVPEGYEVLPFGVPGEHMRRSNIAKYRDDVAVCSTIEEVRAGVERFGPKVVLKAEFSSGGQGLRWRWDGETEAWAKNRLRQDGKVTVEPFMEIVTELSGEFLYGHWNGVSIVLVEHGMWRGQWLGDEHEVMSDEVYDFVFNHRQVEKTLCALNVPERCGMPCCGLDLAIVRTATGGLEVRLLELNARMNMVRALSSLLC